MSFAFPPSPGRWARLLVVAALVVPSLFDLPYHCRASGEMLGAPCAEDRRAQGERARNCCAESEDTQTSATAECCEAAGADTSLLASSGVLENHASRLILVSIEIPVWDKTPAGAHVGASRASPAPPSHPPPFLLHSRFLC